MLRTTSFTLRLSHEMLSKLNRKAEDNFVSTSELMREVLSAFLSKEGMSEYEFPSRAHWQHAIKKRDNYTCQQCGEKRHRRLHAHHLIPIYDGGKNTLSNGITLCKKCHGAAHNIQIINEPKKKITPADVHNYSDAIRFTKRPETGGHDIRAAQELCRHLGIEIPEYALKCLNKDRKCEILDCDLPVRAKGLCNKHYARQYYQEHYTENSVQKFCSSPSGKS